MSNSTSSDTVWIVIISQSMIINGIESMINHSTYRSKESAIKYVVNFMKWFSVEWTNNLNGKKITIKEYDFEPLFNKNTPEYTWSTVSDSIYYSVVVAESETRP